MQRELRVPRHAISVEIPPGYLELPLTNVDEAMRAAEPAIRQATSGRLQQSVPATLGTLRFLLGSLASRGAVYCGIGVHQSSTGEPVTSWLTISCLDVGKPSNPRLVVLELAQAKMRERSSWRLEPVEVDDRPILFAQAELGYPAPDLPAVPDDVDVATAYQLEALVPSADGTTLAAIEVSTSAVEHGPDFAAMLFTLAASLTFEPSTAHGSSLDL